MSFVKQLTDKIENLREELMSRAISELEQQLIPFFIKYDRVDAIEFSSDTRGDDEGHDWIQFDFYIVVDGKMLYGSEYYHEDESGNWKNDIWAGNVIDDIPLDHNQLIDLFGTGELVFSRPEVLK